jgi:hypothetical protein
MEKMIPERVSRIIEGMRRDIGGKRKSEERETCLGVVSVLDPLLSTALDHPTYSPALPIISRNEHSEAVEISMSMPVPSNNTRALHCPSMAAMQEPSKPLGEVGTPDNTPYKGPRHIPLSLNDFDAGHPSCHWQ